MLKLIFICSFEGVCLYIILDSSMVEHTAVNRGVVGSSPTRGATREIALSSLFFLALILYDIYNMNNSIEEIVLRRVQNGRYKRFI